jgi:hypothetical protein
VGGYNGAFAVFGTVSGEVISVNCNGALKACWNLGLGYTRFGRSTGDGVGLDYNPCGRYYSVYTM